MPASLTGTGRLADDLYLLAHDDVRGRPYLQPRALGTGLAGALIGELMLADAVWIDADRLGCTGRGEPADGLGDRILGTLWHEPHGHPVSDWLAFLARTSAQTVTSRLAGAGYLAEARSRWHGTRWVPVSPDSAFGPVVRIRAVLDPRRRPAAADAMLAGLAAACGLGPRVLADGPTGAREALDARIRGLRPDVRNLIAQTQAAVDSALLSHRV